MTDTNTDPDLGTGSTRRTGRNRFGRFQPGNVVGRRGGNPKLKLLSEHQAALREAVTPGELVEVVRALLARARQGDTLAGRILLERYGGKPSTHELKIPSGYSDAQILRGLAVAIAQGSLPPEAANSIAGVLNLAVELDTVAELTRRLDAYEGRL